MATDLPVVPELPDIPPPCPKKFISEGECLCVVKGNPIAIENWVEKVRVTIGNRNHACLNWYYAPGNLARVQFLGSHAKLLRTLAVIATLATTFDGSVLHIISADMFEDK
jgi:hypothetical protein